MGRLWLSREPVYDLKGNKHTKYDITSVRNAPEYETILKRLSELLPMHVKPCPKCQALLLPLPTPERDLFFRWCEWESLGTVHVDTTESFFKQPVQGGFVRVLRAHSCFPDPIKMLPPPVAKKRKSRWGDTVKAINRKELDDYSNT